MGLTTKERIDQLEAENAQMRAQIAQLTEALVNATRALSGTNVVTVPMPAPSPQPYVPQSPYPWTTICDSGIQSCTTKPDGTLTWNVGAEH